VVPDPRRKLWTMNLGQVNVKKRQNARNTINKSIHNRCGRSEAIGIGYMFYG